MAYFKECYVIKNVEDSTYLYECGGIAFSNDILDAIAFELIEDCEKYIYDLEDCRNVHFLEIKKLFADYNHIKIKRSL